MAVMVNDHKIVIEVALSDNAVEHGTVMGRQLSRVDFQVDEDYTPVPMAGGVEGGGTALVRGTIKPWRLADLAEQPEVINVWLDSSIDFFEVEFDERETREDAQRFCPIKPCDCDRTPTGDIQDVAKRLRVPKVWQAGYGGSGVVVGIVDSGIRAKGRVPKGGIPNVIGGYPADWGTRSVGQHGNMVAANCLKMAPLISMYDLRVIDAQGGLFSNACQAFQWALSKYRQDGTPQVLNCSWGINKRVTDPVYASSPDHFFTQKVREVVQAGITVLFAAGNCGPACPLSICGNDSGPGLSIWGANGLAEVLTIGAVNVNDELIGYSSCGPAALSQNKPDFCGISEFDGFLAGGDFGTSAACPLVAGVVALLKSKAPALTPAQLKVILQRTARQIGGLSGWNAFSGFGVVDAWEAFRIIP